MGRFLEERRIECWPEIVILEFVEVVSKWNESTPMRSRASITWLV